MPFFFSASLDYTRTHTSVLLITNFFVNAEAQELDEYFIDLVPELCQLKILGFSKDTGSSISLLPSIIHRLQNLLVAIELKCLLSASFPEAAEVSADRVRACLINSIEWFFKKIIELCFLLIGLHYS